MTRAIRNVGRPLIALAVALLSIAANCEQCQPIPDPRRGNVDRVADAVLVEGTNDHTYLLTSNPEIEHLRVLDLTAERFADGPNRFFPLSIPVGKETRRLAIAADDESFAFALDVAADRIFMIRTPAAGGEPWLQVGDPIPTANAAADLAVHVQDGAFVLTLSLPDVGSVQRIVVDDGAHVQSEEVTLLPDGAVPAEVVVSLEGDAILVGDAIGPAVHVLYPLDGSYDRSLDVGGPQGAISTGFVDVGDGEAAVALVARRDAEEVWALRLARAGFREDRVAVLGGTTVGALPLATYVNDVRDQRTVCCRGLSNDAVNRGEATSAFGGVALGNGTIVYLALAAEQPDGARVVRFIDDDPLPLSQDDVTADEQGEDTLWVPGDGPDADLKRPDPPEFRAVTDFGDPPFFEAPNVDEVLLLAWEAAPPGMRSVRVGYASGTVTAVSANLEARGARVGDRAVFALEDADADCEDREIAATITAVAGLELSVALGAGVDALDDDEQLCLEASGALRVAVELADAFAVSDGADRFLGRLALVARDGTVPPDGELALPGSVMTVRESEAGPPNHGARLAVPLDPHLVVLGLDLADSVGRLGEGGFGSAGYLIGTVLGRTMRFPDPTDEGAVVRARRMIITTGSADASGLNVVFSCDDAETIPGLCDSYR